MSTGILPVDAPAWVKSAIRVVGRADVGGTPHDHWRRRYGEGIPAEPLASYEQRIGERPDPAYMGLRPTWDDVRCWDLYPGGRILYSDYRTTAILEVGGELAGG